MIFSCSIVKALHCRSSPNSLLRGHVTSRSLITTAWFIPGTMKHNDTVMPGYKGHTIFDMAVLHG